MLKDRMKTTTRTKTFRYTDGSTNFKARTHTVTFSTDDHPYVVDVTARAAEFYAASGRGHTSLDVHVSHSQRTDKVQVFDLDDGVYSIIVAGVSLFVNKTQFEGLRDAMHFVGK